VSHLVRQLAQPPLSERQSHTRFIAERVRYGMPFRQERSWVIGRDLRKPFAATGVLSLGLLIPFGAGTFFADRSAALAHSVVASVASAPVAADDSRQQKYITLIENGVTTTVETRAATVADLLIERGIVPALEDRLTPDAASSLSDGTTVEFRAAVPVTLIVDDERHSIRTAARTVGDVLNEAGVKLAARDKVFPTRDTAFAQDAVIRVTRRLAWQERVRMALAPTTKLVYAFGIKAGQHKIIKAGLPGVREVTYAYAQDADATAPHRRIVASRIVRPARETVVAEGISEFESSASIAKRGMDGTIRLATAALSMVATAYTANCYGCSGRAALGMRAGHGIVAVDPRVIRLGSHLYIPGYGHAIAGDTGGAIIGNRIDLGFESNSDALVFGRRAIRVYVLK
jgi:3D (Asp-Asp-Asp) domain-containing protein